MAPRDTRVSVLTIIRENVSSFSNLCHPSAHAEPPAEGLALPVDAPLSSLLDYVCLQLMDTGATGGAWQLASQYPPIKLKFRPDASSDDDLRQQTFQSTGLAPSASLNLTAA